MNSSNNKLTVAITVVLALGLPASALATNGTNSEGFGPKDRGMGGAGVARATETQSIVNNPAAVTAVGERMDLALGLFSPNDRGFELTGNGGGLNQAQTSDSKVFPIPFFGYSRKLDGGAAWAFTISALGGLNTDYPNNFAGVPNSRTGIDLAQMFFGGTYGAPLSDTVSWGVTASLDYQRFQAEGLQAFTGASSDPTKLSDNGYDTSTGFGLKFGLRGDLEGGGSWGASYRLKSDMSEFDDYAGLFPNQGDLDIAPTFTVGVAIPVADDTVLAVDYHFIDYEAVDTISNATSKFPPLQFGVDDGPGFGWESINVIKLGVEVQTSDDMTWRGGINYGESPLAADEFSTAFLVPATVTTHLSAGFTRRLDANSEITAVWVHTLNESQTGAFSPTFGGGTLQAEMEQNFIEISYGTRF